MNINIAFPVQLCLLLLVGMAIMAFELASAKFTPAPLPVAEAWTSQARLDATMQRVIEWQQAQPRKYAPTFWAYGAYYSGVVAYAKSQQDNAALSIIKELGDSLQWRISLERPHGYFADDHAIGHALTEYAATLDDPTPIAHLQAALDHAIAYPDTGPVDKRIKNNIDRWSWCDALFMSPPTLVKLAGLTGDTKYLEFMDKEYKACYDVLFDQEEKLFYRDARFIGKATANGKKVFWSRGNGWVCAGLPLMLRDMPQDWQTRPFYTQLLQDMVAALKKHHTKDGTWHPSLADPLDPDVRELSGTLFICYALAWGMNEGILSSQEYLPTLQRAWQTVESCIDSQGAIGYIQPIGDSPQNCTQDSHEAFGPGAYLLAATEIKKLLITQAHPHAKRVIVENPTMLFRHREVISCPCSDTKISNAATLRVYDMREGRVIPHQLVDTTGDGTPDELLFQADLWGKTKRTFLLMESTTLPPATCSTTCTARTVPERMDDFAWENDLTAYRTYGPALRQPPPTGESLISGGIDVWSKRTTKPTIDAFYKRRDYHADHPDGLDWYKVGTGPGCGGTILSDMPAKGKYTPVTRQSSENWQTARVLATGPIRTIFQLTYFYSAHGIIETRTGQLDAGSPYTKFTSTFAPHPSVNADKLNSFSLGVGIDTAPARQHNGQVQIDLLRGTISNWEPNHPQHGNMATAIYCPPNSKTPVCLVTHNDGLYLFAPLTDNKAAWYSGATWSQAPRQTSQTRWHQQIINLNIKHQNPVIIQIDN